MAKLWILFVFALCSFLILLWKEISKEKREKRYKNEVTRLKRLARQEKYVEALDLLKREPILIARYKLDDVQKREILEIELYCLKKIGRIEDAVVALGMHLSMFYPIGEWDKELLERWISLYKSSPPIKAEKFNFTARVGVHPRTNALIKYAIEEKDCTPPIGFSGMMNVAVLKEFGKRKGIYSEKKNLKKKKRIIATPQVWKSEKWKYEIKFPANWHPIARYDQKIQSPNADVFCENSKGSSAVVFVVEHRDSRTLAEIEADLLKSTVDNYRGAFGDITRMSGKEYIQNGITYRRFTYSMGGFIHRYILALHNSCEYAISLTCPEAHFIKAERDFDYIANSLKFLSGTISGSKRKNLKMIK